MSTIIAVGRADDIDLVGRALDNDQAAWNQLVAKYTRLVWHVIHGFPQLDADLKADVHQTVWLRLAEQLEHLRDPAKVGGWLATTARNECIRQARRSAREVPTADEFDVQTSGEPLDDLLRSDRDTDLWRAFSELRQECQQLLRLQLADPPFSYDEISEILDMPRGSIGPSRQRCLGTLRAALTDTIWKETR